MKDANRAHLGRHVVVRVLQISQALERVREVEGALNEADKARAGRFRIEEDRWRFFAGRELLRNCLEEFWENPALLRDLNLTSRGRPFFETRPEIQFSLSHSGDLVSMALTLKTSVGVDFEAIDRRILLPELAARLFSPEDLAAFHRLPAGGARDAFFRAWTAKEAYLKATGLGISAGLEAIRVPLDASSEPRPFKPGGAENPDWFLQSLPLPPGYIGHVVWDDPQKCLDFRVLDSTAGRGEG